MMVSSYAWNRRKHPVKEDSQYTTVHESSTWTGVPCERCYFCPHRIWIWQISRRSILLCLSFEQPKTMMTMQSSRRVVRLSGMRWDYLCIVKSSQLLSKNCAFKLMTEFLASDLRQVGRNQLQTVDNVCEVIGSALIVLSYGGYGGMAGLLDDCNMNCGTWSRFSSCTFMCVSLGWIFAAFPRVGDERGGTICTPTRACSRIFCRNQFEVLGLRCDTTAVTTTFFVFLGFTWSRRIVGAALVALCFSYGRLVSAAQLGGSACADLWEAFSCSLADHHFSRPSQFSSLSFRFSAPGNSTHNATSPRRRLATPLHHQLLSLYPHQKPYLLPKPSTRFQPLRSRNVTTRALVRS